MAQLWGIVGIVMRITLDTNFITLINKLTRSRVLQTKKRIIATDFKIVFFLSLNLWQKIEADLRRINLPMMKQPIQMLHS
jgi:hypothetical protein